MSAEFGSQNPSRHCDIFKGYQESKAPVEAKCGTCRLRIRELLQDRRTDANPSCPLRPESASSPSRIAAPAQNLALHGRVAFLDHAPDEPERLEERHTALEQQTRMTLRWAAKRGIEDEAAPEFTFDTARLGVDSDNRRLKYTLSVQIGESKQPLEVLDLRNVIWVLARLRRMGAAQFGRRVLIRMRSFFAASGSLLVSVAKSLLSGDAHGLGQRSACTKCAEDIPDHAITFRPSGIRWPAR